MADHTPCHYDALGKRLAIGQRVYFTSHNGSPYVLGDQRPGIVVKLWPQIVVRVDNDKGGYESTFASSRRLIIVPDTEAEAWLRAQLRTLGTPDA